MKLWWSKKTVLPDGKCQELLAERDALLETLRTTWVPPDAVRADHVTCSQIRRRAAHRLHEVDLKLREGCERFLKP